MRFTKKDKKGNHYSIIRANTVKDITDFSDKLGKFEDIEEKHSLLSSDDLDKRLTALKIIKKKRVDVELWRFTGSRDSYNRLVCEDRQLLEEEHELLKEVLLWLYMN